MQWPELLGVDGDVAAATIERENLGVNATIIVEGTGSVARDFSCGRCKVYVNKEGIVVRVPQVN